MAKKRTSLNDRLSENGKGISRAVSAFISNVNASDESNVESKNDTKDDTENVSKSDSKNVSKDDTENVSKNDTKNDTKNVSNYVSPKVSKKVSIGEYKLQIDGHEETKRIPYLLSLSTIEKVNTVAKLTNLKKYELVDLILSSVCDEILKKSK